MSFIDVWRLIQTRNILKLTQGNLSMSVYCIRVADSRFDGLNMNKAERLLAIEEMIKEGALDLNDEFIEGISVEGSVFDRE